MNPTAHRVPLRGLSFHLLEWAPPPDVDASGMTVLLLHGFADAAGSWESVAPILARAGHAVFAPDLRGYGATSWISPDGYYHFFDHVGDVDAIVDHIAAPRLALVGHSMGGTVATLWAGARPGAVTRLALLEGVGPPDSAPKDAPERATRWLDSVRGGRGRGGNKAFSSMEEAIERLATTHPEVPRDVIAQRAKWLVKEEDGRFAWRFDPLHRTPSPVPFYAAAFRAFAQRVACPVLLVSGGETGFHPSDEAEREASYRDRRRIELAGAGHMIHWTQPEALARELVSFFAG